MFEALREMNGIKRFFSMLMIVGLTGCATATVQGGAQTEIANSEATVSEVISSSTMASSFCDAYATQPNYRLWHGINETSKITTYVRNGADGEIRYCVRFEVEGDPDVISGAGCASSPDLAIATFAYEFPAYLCGVTNE